MATKSSEIIRLFITPQTHVRATKGDAICFRIPEKTLIEKYPRLYKRKMQLEKYNKYKAELRGEAARVGFVMPVGNAWIKFYMPMPQSWSKKKKLRMNFMPKQSMPDLSNLIKAMEDALLKQDNVIWDYRVSKYWYDSCKGYIEVCSLWVLSHFLKLRTADLDTHPCMPVVSLYSGI